MADNCVTVIDIGSGSMKASVFVDAGDKVVSLASISRGFRLCANIGNDISDRKMDITSDFIKKVVKMTREHSSSQIIAVATQAARKASNFSDLQEKISQEHGINIHIISGKEEAGLAAMSVKYFTNLTKFISFDIGCGSIEIAEFDEKVNGTWSVPVSSLALSKSDGYEAAESVINKSFEKLKFKSCDISAWPLIGNGGTLRVSKMLMENNANDVITYSGLVALFEFIKGKTESERIALGVPKVRCDILPFGILIIIKLMEHLRVKELTLAHGNLRMSLALKFFKKLAG